MADKTKINLGLQLANFQEFRRNLLDALGDVHKLSTEFQGVETDVKVIEKTLSGVNKVISILTTKVSADGKMSVTTAKELRQILADLNKTSLSLSDSEQSRLDPNSFRAKIKFLTDENSVLAKNLAKYEEQTAELEKQEKLLEKQTKISSYLKGKKGVSDDIKTIAGNFDDEQLRAMVTPTGSKGDYTKRQKEILQENGITIEQAREIKKIYVEMDNLAQATQTKISSIKTTIEGTQTIIAEEKAKVQNLLSQGVSVPTSPLDIVDNNEELSGKLNALIHDAEKTNKSFIEMDGAVSKTSDTFSGLTKKLISTRAVMNTLRRVMDEAIHTVQEMDKALTGMTAVTGKSREEVVALIPELKRLAQETSSTMTEIADLTTEYLRQGRAMEDSLELAKETARAAKIAGISTSESLTYMTSAVNGFNLAASDAGHISDVFANVAAKTATDYEQLAIALSKVSAQANLAGMSMEYTTALLAKGIETTQEAPESIGTALKTVIARMRELTSYNKVLEDGTDVNKVEAALGAVGISLRDTTGKFRDLEDVFNELGPKWDSLNTMQQQAIAQSVAGTRQQSRFIAIMQDWERTMENVAIAEDSAGAAAYQYSKIAEGLEANLTNLTTAWQGFTTSLVDTEFVIDILQSVTSFLNTLTDMSSLLKTIGIAVLAIVGYNKANKLFLDYKYKKRLELLALEKETEEYGIKNGERLRKELIQEQAKLEIMRNQNKELEKQQQREKDIILNPNLTPEEKQKQLNIAQKEWSSTGRPAEMVTPDELSEQEQKVANLSKQHEHILITKIKQLSTDIKILFTSGKTLNSKQAQSMLENNSLLNQIKLLFLSKKKLDANTALTAQQKAQLLLQKKQALASLRNLGTMAAIAVLAVMLVNTIKTVNKLLHTQEEALKSIEEHSNNIYELNQKSNELTQLIDEYEKLYNVVNRTKEEEARLLELEHQLQGMDGIDGSGSSLIASAKAKDSAYQAKMTEERDAMVASTMLAFTKAANKVDFFKNSTFENAFKRKYEMQLDTNLEEEMSKAVATGILTMEEYNIRLREAQRIGKGVLQNIDSQSVASAVTAATTYQNRDTGWDIAQIAGETIGGAGVGAAAGAGIGAAVQGWTAAPGAIIGAIIGGVIGLAHSVAVTWQENTQEYADQLAEQQALIMSEYTNEIAAFSQNMAMNMDESLATKYKLVTQALNNADYTEQTKDAIEEMFSTVLAVFRNPKIKALVNEINDLLPETGDALVSEMTEIFHGFGDDSLNHILNIIKNQLVAGATETEARAAVAVAFANKNGPIFTEAKKIFDENKQAQIESLTNLLKNDKDLEARAKAEDVSVEAYRKQLQEELGKLRAAEYEFSEEYLNTQTQLLDSISKHSSLLDLQQSLKALDSANESLIKINDSLNQGKLSFEELTTLAQNFSGTVNEQEFYDALANEGLEGVRNLLMNDLIEPYDQYLKQLDDFIIREETRIKMYPNSEIAKSAEQNIKLLNAYRKEYMSFNKVTLETYAREFKIAALEEEKNKGNIAAYEELITLKELEYKESQEQLNQYFKDYPKEYELIKKIRSGVISVEDAWEQVGDSENFKRMVENSEEWFKKVEEYEKELTKLRDDSLAAQIEIQNKALDVYKEKLEAEKEALQKSLDKRRDMYNKYFDLLDERADDEDFATKQGRLRSALAALSTASDATSLELRRQYQEELNELEKEQSQAERDRRREATETTFDNMEEQMEQYYEDRLNNEQQLWKELTRLSEKELSTLYTTYNKEYKKSTDLNQQYLLDSFTTVINGVKKMAGISVPGYSTGGLVTHTGLAAVHGSPSAPEAFLNASQTALFGQLAQNLENYYNRPVAYSNPSEDSARIITIENIKISVEGQLTDNNMVQTGESLAEALLNGLRRTGIQVNKKR